jgi:RHS repeat-associated protein
MAKGKHSEAEIDMESTVRIFWLNLGAALRSWLSVGLVAAQNQFQNPAAAPACFNSSGALQTTAAYCYDAAGNMMTDTTGASHYYDAENHLKSLPTLGYSYLYDGDGKRVAKLNSSGQATKLYWYGSGDDILAETDASGNTQNEYVFFGGKRIAMLPAGGAAQYYVEDMLGSSRVVTSNTGVVCYDADFYPYGGERAYTDTCTQNNYKFTGKERDSESGNDYFGARYYASTMGRFMSPDWSSTPAAIPFAHPADPQTLNLYSYVVNNPLNRTDPTGHNWFCTSGGNANCKNWEWHKGSTYTDANGNVFKSNYTGLLAAQANGTDKKTGATLYKLTLYDQNKAVATGTGFSGGNGMAPIRDGNYLIRLDIRDPNGPNSINPNSPLNNPPAYFGIQKMHNITDSQGTWDVVGAYGPIRARLNPMSGKDEGDYFHGQTNGHGYTHGCLCYGTDTRFADYMWNNMPHAPLPAAIDVPTEQPQQ